LGKELARAPLFLIPSHYNVTKRTNGMNKIFAKAREISTKHFVKMVFYSSLVGVIAGLGAVIFRYLIAFFHNLFFFGTLSFSYNSNLHFISKFGNYIIVIPIIGMVIIGYLTHRYAPEAKGHGVPEVMDAVLKNKGRIRPIVSLIKILASAIGIGAGESAGREGPIVQIGSSFGSTLGQLLHLHPRDTILLVGAGAAGGIAATFNAPIAGVLFAVELILPEFSTQNFIPLVISSTIATNTARIFLGVQPSFIVPQYTIVSHWEFLLYFILGIVSGFIAILFTDMLGKVEVLFNKMKMSAYIKPAIGGLVVGVSGLLFLKGAGHYYIFGVGYAFISDVLTNQTIPLLVVLTLIFVKIIATTFSLGSGGSGGIFAPSLFVGAATGAAFGIIVHHFFPTVTALPAAYALIGMASVASGTTGATLTTIVMSYELTRSYEIILPVMLGAVISGFITTFLYGKTMYTEPLLRRRGILFHGKRELNLLSMIRVEESMVKDAVYVYQDDKIKYAKGIATKNKIAKIPVLDRDNHPVGLIHYMDIAHKDDEKKITEFIEKLDLSIPSYTTLLDAVHKMKKIETDILVVVDAKNRFIGILTAARLRAVYVDRRSSLL